MPSSLPNIGAAAREAVSAEERSPCGHDDCAANARLALDCRIAGRRVVVSVSGGKDSAATCLYLQELGIEHDRVFADTGWEHPVTYDYLRGELTRKLGPIVEVSSGETLPELVRRKGMFPSRKFRFCTQFLKVAPLARYLDSLDVELVNVVGIRAEESAARAAFPEWEPWTVTLKPSEGGPLSFSCDVWRPLIRWTEDDVIQIHKRHGLRPNPLYLQGASRVGCWPCINARKAELRMLVETDPARIGTIRALEADVQAGAIERAAAKGTTLEAQGFAHPTFFQGFTAEPGPGRKRGMWPIDRVVAWSKTSRGGRQLEVFADPHDGCARWGMCDAGPADVDGKDPSP